MRRLREAWSLASRLSAIRRVAGIGGLGLIGVIGGASVASAGWNLSWNDCGSAGKATELFTCDTNSGKERIVCSIVPPPGLTAIIGCELKLTVYLPTFGPSDAGPLWWQFNSGGCREGAMTVDLDSSWGPHCPTLWGPRDTVLTAYQLFDNVANISIATSVPADSAARVIVPGQEYFAFEILIDNAKTQGTQACTDCQTPAMILRTYGSVTDQYFNSQSLGAAQRDTVYWQWPTVPTQRSSWGAVKAIYR